MQSVAYYTYTSWCICIYVHTEKELRISWIDSINHDIRRYISGAQHLSAASARPRTTKKPGIADNFNLYIQFGGSRAFASDATYYL